MRHLKVSFRDMEHSDAMEADVRERASRLERLHPRLSSCEVMVESPHKHHHKGRHYNVRIDMVVPGHELVVNHHHQDDVRMEDAYFAIKDAFGAAERQLRDLRERELDRR